MTEKSQDSPTPEPEQAEPRAEKPVRRRPSRGQVLVAVGALMAVLAVAGSGFAIGRATADDGGHEDRHGHGERFDQREPGGPGMMPDAPQAPEDSQTS